MRKKSDLVAEGPADHDGGSAEAAGPSWEGIRGGMLKALLMWSDTTCIRKGCVGFSPQSGSPGGGVTATYCTPNAKAFPIDS